MGVFLILEASQPRGRRLAEGLAIIFPPYWSTWLDVCCELALTLGCLIFMRKPSTFFSLAMNTFHEVARVRRDPCQADEFG